MELERKLKNFIKRKEVVSILGYRQLQKQKYSCLVTATHNNFGGNAESEGIQLKGDYVYFGISDKQSSDKACIYSIPKSAF